MSDFLTTLLNREGMKGFVDNLLAAPSLRFVATCEAFGKQQSTRFINNILL